MIQTLLLMLSLMLLGTAQPQIGFLRIYNCMSEHTAFTPRLATQTLTATPLLPGENLSGAYFQTGKHDLFLESDTFSITPTRVTIRHNQTITILALHLPQKRTDQLQPVLVSLSDTFDATHSKDTIPLRLRSFSQKTLDIKTSFGSISLASRKSTFLPGCTGAPFTLHVSGQDLGLFEPEDHLAHTLVIWDANQSEVKAVLIPNIKYLPPADLRNDLSFGKKREEFKNLKTLSPRQPK